MFVRNRGQLVVDCYPPGRVRLLWVAIVVLGAALLWTVVIYAPGQVARNAADAEAQRINVLSKFAGVEKDRASLRASVQGLERARQMDRDAYAALQKDYDVLHRESFELREKLAFYQAITTPEKGRPAVAVQRMLLEQDGSSNRYAYSVVLVQSKEKKPVTGSLSFTIRGTLNGQSRQLSMDEISAPSVAEQSVGFRYFQDLAGWIDLPAGFVPQRLELRLKLAAPYRDIKKSYTWAMLQGGGS